MSISRLFKIILKLIISLYSSFCKTAIWFSSSDQHALFPKLNVRQKRNTAANIVPILEELNATKYSLNECICQWVTAFEFLVQLDKAWY